MHSIHKDNYSIIYYFFSITLLILIVFYIFKKFIYIDKSCKCNNNCKRIFPNCDFCKNKIEYEVSNEYFTPNIDNKNLKQNEILRQIQNELLRQKQNEILTQKQNEILRQKQNEILTQKQNEILTQKQNYVQNLSNLRKFVNKQFKN